MNAHDRQPSIALIRQRYTRFGGAERFVERALEGLERQGAHVTVIAASLFHNVWSVLVVVTSLWAIRNRKASSISKCRVSVSPLPPSTGFAGRRRPRRLPYHQVQGMGIKVRITIQALDGI